MPLMISPSQTIGPFSAFSLTPTDNNKAYNWLPLVSNEMAGPEVSGEHIEIRGRVLTGAGAPHKLTMLEFWQADGKGRFQRRIDNGEKLNTSFSGYGRCETDGDGRFTVRTIKPGRILGADGSVQAPHVTVAIHSPMLLTHLCTRIYFDDERDNVGDAVLALVPADRRSTLIARRTDDTYNLDIVTQGDDETVFFNF